MKHQISPHVWPPLVWPISRPGLVICTRHTILGLLTRLESKNATSKTLSMNSVLLVIPPISVILIS